MMTSRLIMNSQLGKGIDPPVPTEHHDSLSSSKKVSQDDNVHLYQVISVLSLNRPAHLSFANNTRMRLPKHEHNKANQEKDAADKRLFYPQKEIQ